MSTEFSPEVINKAADWYKNPRAYPAFTVIAGGWIMSGCLDPRTPSPNKKAGVIRRQGPGGDVGTSSNLAHARTAIEDELILPETAAHDMLDANRATIAGAHPFCDCAYCKGYLAITNEKANPQAATLDTYEKLTIEDGWALWLPKNALPRAIDSAKQHLEYQQVTNTNPVVNIPDLISAAHYDYENVRPMRGKATPRFYTLNRTSHLGFSSPSSDLHLGIERPQTYHDNVTARVEALQHWRGLGRDLYRQLIAETLYDSAATRTVINDMKRAEGVALRNIEIIMSRIGLIGVEVNLT